MAIFGQRVWNGYPACLPDKVCRAVHTPPAPFQQKAIKDGPGRGRGAFTPATVLSQSVRPLFPLLEGGHAVRLIFLCLVRCPLLCFRRSSLLRVAV